MSIPIIGENNHSIRKQSELRDANIPDHTSVIKTEILQMVDCAKQLGYKDLISYLKAYFTDDYMDEYVNEIYDGFLQCVQQGISKDPWGEGVWDEESEFFEFVSNTKKELTVRLEQLEWERKTQYPSFGGIIQVLPDIKGVPEGVGMGLDAETGEFYTYFIRKSIEFVSRLLVSRDKLDNYLKNALAKRKEIEDLEKFNKKYLIEQDN